MQKPTFKTFTPSTTGDVIRHEEGALVVGNNPIIPYIEGDGIGKDIWPACQHVIDAAVNKAYTGERKIEWVEIFAGEKAYTKFGEHILPETIGAIKYFKVAIKGPLATPVAGGIRSLNVYLRQELDLYACIRPIVYFDGIDSPLKHPENVNLVIFRENTEGIYAGIEYQKDSEEAKKLRKFLLDTFGTRVRDDAGIGIKPISEFASKRLMRKAIEYAKAHNRRSITVVHKGNIQKYTEGAFRNWAYEVAAEEYKDDVCFDHNKCPDKIQIQEGIADAMFQNLLLSPEKYDILVTTNLNGDYLSDACAAEVGGLGIAPGANMSDTIALFEATHGTAPSLAGLNKANPTSLILSGVLMLEYMGWQEAATLIIKAVQQAIKERTLTPDLAPDTALSTQDYTQVLLKKIQAS